MVFINKGLERTIKNDERVGYRAIKKLPVREGSYISFQGIKLYVPSAGNTLFPSMGIDNSFELEMGFHPDLQSFLPRELLGKDEKAIIAFLRDRTLKNRGSPSRIDYSITENLLLGQRYLAIQSLRKDIDLVATIDDPYKLLIGSLKFVPSYSSLTNTEANASTIDFEDDDLNLRINPNESISARKNLGSWFNQLRYDGSKGFFRQLSLS